MSKMDGGVSLIEKARAVPLRRKLKGGRTREQVELAVGWAKGGVTATQVGRVIYSGAVRAGGSTLTWLATTLRDGVAQGWIEIVEK